MELLGTIIIGEREEKVARKVNSEGIGAKRKGFTMSPRRN